MSAQEGIEIIDSFIRVAESIEKLPRLTLPEYRNAALDLAKICFKILAATRISVSWFNCFSNFQFIRDPLVVIPDYDNLIGKYNELRLAGVFRKLDFACGEIGSIYYSNLQNSINMIFSDKSQSERDDVRGIFEGLSNADNNMVAFVSKQIVNRLDSFVSSTNEALKSGTDLADIDKLKIAEQRKLEFNRDSRDITHQLVKINDALIDLVIKFAAKSGTGISSIFDNNDFTKKTADTC